MPRGEGEASRIQQSRAPVPPRDRSRSFEFDGFLEARKVVADTGTELDEVTQRKRRGKRPARACGPCPRYRPPEVVPGLGPPSDLRQVSADETEQPRLGLLRYCRLVQPAAEILDRG